MRVILDTHAFIWWTEEPARLSPRVLTLCKDPGNDLFLSLVSLWEIQIKMQLGKLTLNQPLPVVIALQQANGLMLLPIIAQHIYELQNLPRHHGDPFDRLLIAQARVEEITLISHDDAFQQYAVDVIW
jgi:PIN domain nuclease of toxin-antitoxin system